MSLTYLSTFTGVGGADRGFDLAGLTCIGMCEIDATATSVLNHHWPEVPKHDDIATAISSGWADQFVGRTDILIGGAPCQDLSVAGRRAGFEGERSVLFFDMVDVARHVQAEYLVYENVPGLLTSAGGRDFAAALTALAEAGFSHIEWRELDSQNFGVPQRRRRIFLIAHTGKRSTREVFPVGESRIGDLASINEAWQTPPTDTARGAHAGRWAGSAVAEETAAPLLSVTGSFRTTDIDGGTWAVETFVKKHRAASDSDYESWAQEHINPTLNVFDNGDTRATTIIVEPQAHAFYSTGGTHGLNNQPEVSPTLKIGSGIDIASPPAVAINNGDLTYTVRRLTPVECTRLQGLPDNWLNVEHNGKPLSDTAKYKLLGNAITVNVAEWVARLIRAHAGDTDV